MDVQNRYGQGLVDGIPIGLAYLAVSFAFGIAGMSKGIPVWAVVIISATCLTSAGQFAGIISIASGGSIVELILSQMVINLRYTIMSIAVGQKLTQDTPVWHRFIMAFGVTDEAFAVSCGRKGEIGSRYFYGIMTVMWSAWTLGTFLGATASGILPEAVMNALGLAIYGMLIALVIPPAKHNPHIVLVVFAAVVCSLVFRYVEVFSFISSGFSIIICTLIAATLGALIFPIKEEADE
ncbi:MAG: AzlC family ABC transporter permease [Anaerostipes sp.]|nr:AzlC family ABC transporter permease [Anaerostipes sp.]